MHCLPLSFRSFKSIKKFKLIIICSWCGISLSMNQDTAATIFCQSIAAFRRLKKKRQILPGSYCKLWTYICVQEST